MPRYADRDPVCVSMPGTGVLYGFQTSIAEADRTTFGHKAIPTAQTTPTVFGCNRPKPPRGKLASGVSSFVDETRYAATEITLINSGRGFPRPYDSAKSQMVYVTVGGVVKYAWYQPKDVQTKLGSVVGLGVEAVGTTDKVFYGVDSMKVGDAVYKTPSRALKVVGDDVASTFCDTPLAGAVPSGFTIASAGDGLI